MLSTYKNSSERMRRKNRESTGTSIKKDSDEKEKEKMVRWRISIWRAMNLFGGN